MNDEERATLNSLANATASMSTTLQKTREELDAIRTLFIGVMNTLASDPRLAPTLAAHMSAAIEGDAAISLGSPMPDSMLQMRRQWLERLIPALIAQSVRLP